VRVSSRPGTPTTLLASASSIENQNLTDRRARVKEKIAELERRLANAHHELERTKSENASLKKNQMAPPQPIPGPEDFPKGTAAIMDVATSPSNQQQGMVMGARFSNSIVMTGQISSGYPSP